MTVTPAADPALRSICGQPASLAAGLRRRSARRAVRPRRIGPGIFERNLRLGLERGARLRRGGGFVLVASLGRKQQVATRRAIGRRRWRQARRAQRQEPASRGLARAAASSAQGGGDAARSHRAILARRARQPALQTDGPDAAARPVLRLACLAQRRVSSSRQVHVRRATCRPGSGPCTESRRLRSATRCQSWCR